MKTENEDDAALLLACGEAAQAGEAYDTIVNASEADELSADAQGLYNREREAFTLAVNTPATTPAGLAAKAALLVRWQDFGEGGPLALSIAKDALAIAETICGGLLR